MFMNRLSNWDSTKKPANPVTATDGYVPTCVTLHTTLN